MVVLIVEDRNAADVLKKHLESVFELNKYVSVLVKSCKEGFELLNSHDTPDVNEVRLFV